MVYSSSIATAEAARATGYQPAFYLMRHSVFLVVGLVAAGIAFQFPLSVWQRYAPILFLAGAVVCCINVGMTIRMARGTRVPARGDVPLYGAAQAGE